MTELKCINYNEDFPDGFAITLPATGSLADLHAILANGRNVMLTLHKDDGTHVTYELTEGAS